MRVFASLVLILAAIAACAFAYAVRPGGLSGEPREVVVTARDMAFTVAGVTGANPTLRVRAGERIRLVLENRDRGMKHDLVVPGLDIRMPTLDFDAIGRRVITVPRTPGTYEYFCSFHDRLMRGRLVIE